MLVTTLLCSSTFLTCQMCTVFCTHDTSEKHSYYRAASTKQPRRRQNENQVKLPEQNLFLSEPDVPRPAHSPHGDSESVKRKERAPARAPSDVGLRRARRSSQRFLRSSTTGAGDGRRRKDGGTTQREGDGQAVSKRLGSSGSACGLCPRVHSERRRLTRGARGSRRSHSSVAFVSAKPEPTSCERRRSALGQQE